MPLVLIFHPLCAIPLLTELVGSFVAVSISPPSPLFMDIPPHPAPDEDEGTPTRTRHAPHAVLLVGVAGAGCPAAGAPQRRRRLAAPAGQQQRGALGRGHLRRRVPAPVARPARRRPPLPPRHGLRRHRLPPLPRRWERTADTSLAASRLQRAPRARSRGGRSGRSMAAAPASVVGLCSPAPSSHGEVRGRGGGRAAAPLLGGRALRRRGPRADRAARSPRRLLLPPGGGAWPISSPSSAGPSPRKRR